MAQFVSKAERQELEKGELISYSSYLSLRVVCRPSRNALVPEPVFKLTDHVFGASFSTKTFCDVSESTRSDLFNRK